MHGEAHGGHCRPSLQIERISLGLGPSAVELALPLNATEGSKLSFATVIGDHVVLKDGIQLPQSTPGRARGECTAPARNTCLSTRPVSTAASRESGGICDTDT